MTYFTPSKDYKGGQKSNNCIRINPLSPSAQRDALFYRKTEEWKSKSPTKACMRNAMGGGIPACLLVLVLV